MKKAYVKPVFLAEEFVAEMSYANNGCGVSVYTPAQITYAKHTDAYDGTTADLCSGSNDGHYIAYEPEKQHKWGMALDYDYNTKNGTNLDYWGYATSGETEIEKQATLFVTVLCDFVWNPNTGNKGNVSVWDTVLGRTEGKQYGSKVVGTFMKFFTGSEQVHPFEYKGSLTPVSG